QAFGLFQHLGDDALGAAHLPQDIGVDAPLPPGDVERLACLGQRAFDRVGDQLLMPLPPRASVIHLRDRLALLVITVGVDSTDRTDAATHGPVAGGGAVGDGDAL